MSGQIDKYNLLSKIAEGEGQNLDFKFEINDPKKIAISIGAFANASGGSLLIGVKDNGRIAGAKPNEEMYLLERAIEKYIRPKPEHYFEKWQVNGKWVLGLMISKEQKSQPFLAFGLNEKWTPYIRIADENIAANAIWYRIQKKMAGELPSFTQFEKHEEKMLKYLKNNDSATTNALCKAAGTHYKAVSNSLVNLVCLKVLQLHITKESNFFTLY